MNLNQYSSESIIDLYGLLTMSTNKNMTINMHKFSGVAFVLRIFSVAVYCILATTLSLEFIVSIVILGQLVLYLPKHLSINADYRHKQVMRNVCVVFYSLFRFVFVDFFCRVYLCQT